MVMDNKGTEAMGTEGGTGQVPLARRRARAGSVWQDGRDIVQERAIRALGLNIGGERPRRGSGSYYNVSRALFAMPILRLLIVFSNRRRCMAN